MKQRGCSIAIVLLVVPPLLLPVLLKMRPGAGDGFALTVAIVGLIVSWLAVSIPVSILVYLDWFRSPSTIRLGRGGRNIARIPVFLFGVVVVLFGVGVLAWYAYNWLIETQPGFREFRWTTIEGVGTTVSVITYGIYLIRLSVWNPASEQPQKTDHEPIVPR